MVVPCLITKTSRKWHGNLLMETLLTKLTIS
jgi:hypothetical protein